MHVRDVSMLNITNRFELQINRRVAQQSCQRACLQQVKSQARFSTKYQNNYPLVLVYSDRKRCKLKRPLKNNAILIPGSAAHGSDDLFLTDKDLAQISRLVPQMQQYCLQQRQSGKKASIFHGRQEVQYEKNSTIRLSGSIICSFFPLFTASFANFYVPLVPPVRFHSEPMWNLEPFAWTGQSQFLPIKELKSSYKLASTNNSKIRKQGRVGDKFSRETATL